MKRYTYLTQRPPLLCITQDWLNDMGWEGWQMVGKRDFNQYIFMKLIIQDDYKNGIIFIYCNEKDKKRGKFLFKCCKGCKHNPIT